MYNKTKIKTRKLWPCTMYYVHNKSIMTVGCSLLICSFFFFAFLFFSFQFRIRTTAQLHKPIKICVSDEVRLFSLLRVEKYPIKNICLQLAFVPFQTSSWVFFEGFSDSHDGAFEHIL